MSKAHREEVFFAYVDDEEAREGIRWLTPPPMEDLMRHYGDFDAYVEHQPLSPPTSASRSLRRMRDICWSGWRSAGHASPLPEPVLHQAGFLQHVF
jgi:hypothetical protein